MLNKTEENLKILDLTDTEISFENAGSLTSKFPLLEEISLTAFDYVTDANIDGILEATEVDKSRVAVWRAAPNPMNR